MIKSTANYINEFSFAFIEELQQDGITFIDKNRSDFIEIEYPHYSDEYVIEMKMIYKWWRHDPNKLSEYKNGLLLRMYEEVSDRIKNDKYFRFMILKTFHDSQIINSVIDSKNKTLTIKIEHDDCFCKTKFGEKIELVFYGLDNCSDNIAEAIGQSVLIMGIEYAVKNNQIEFEFELLNLSESDASYGNPHFLCDKIEIKSY